MIDFRAPTVADVPAMAELETTAYGQSAWSQATLTAEVEGAYTWYLAAFGDDLLGYVGLQLLPPTCDLQTLTVAEQARGNGLGRDLLLRAIAHARKESCTRMFCEVREDNKAAQHLYASVGFTRIGKRTRYYADGADAHNLRLRLGSKPSSEELS